MRITCVGGGPGGLYFAIAAKAQDPACAITVLERRPPGTTYGWGVVYWDDLLDGVRRVDPPTARAIRAGSVRWPGQRVSVQDRPPVHLGGTGYGMSRQRLIDVLTHRARELGVEVRFEQDVDDLVAERAADLVVLADGANSRLRRGRVAEFGTTEQSGRNKHIWLGSRAPFSDFTFAFERTAAGWIWFHGYRFGHDGSTVIVECSQSTWQALGFNEMDDATCRAELDRIFQRHLAGNRLENRPDALGRAEWTTFTTVHNAHWSCGSTVLAGDCAHTAHFSIGSGTRMAFEDAAALARALGSLAGGGLSTALEVYQRTRQPLVLALQEDAARSAGWFEHIDDHIRLDPLQFGYSLRMRRTVRPGAEVARPPLAYGLHRLTQWQLGRSARRLLATGRHTTLRRRAGHEVAVRALPRQGPGNPPSARDLAGRPDA
jgi:anthraniloyl-CoA monooxygenase